MTEPILFPSLFAVGGVLLPTTKKAALKSWIKRYIGNNQFIFRYVASPKLRVGFIVDRTGAFRELVVLRFTREWARPIAWFYDFLLAEGELSPPEIVTNRTLLTRLRELSGDPHFPTARQLRRFLRKEEIDAILDSHSFHVFWNQICPEPPPSEWSEQYPDG